MSRDLILIGGGGHCKSCIEVIEKTQQFNIIGILDTFEKIGSNVLNYPIIGTDNDMSIWKDKKVAFLITVGHIKNNEIRKKIYRYLSDRQLNIETIISPLATVSQYSSIGRGTILMHHTTLNPDSCISENCIINTNALIEHDCIIGNHTHISTGAVINGGCTIGDNVFIGSRVVIGHGVTIRNNVIVGAGSLVLKSIYTEGVYVGSPVHKIA